MREIGYTQKFFLGELNSNTITKQTKQKQGQGQSEDKSDLQHFEC